MGQRARCKACACRLAESAGQSQHIRAGILLALQVGDPETVS